MGDASYKNIDFERMLSDLGAALERNASEPGTRPAEQPPMPAAAPAQAGGIPTARFGDVPPSGAQQTAPMTVAGGPPSAAPMSPQDAQTSSQLDAAAPGAVAFGGGHPAPSPMSPQDMQTLAQLSQLTPGAIAFGGGTAPTPTPYPVAAQLAQAAQQPTAMSAPPTTYPNIDPNEAGGLAGYAALR